MKESEARRTLKRAGWYRVRFAKGRHEVWKPKAETTSDPNQYITLTSKARGRAIDRNLRVKLLKLKRGSESNVR